MDKCPCGSDLKYSECCEPILKGEQAAETAQQMMRARYSAYATGETDYLLTSLHPDQRESHDSESVLEWAKNADWQGLEIVETQNGEADDSEGDVEFIAHFTHNDNKEAHHELAHFKKEDGVWYYENGEDVKPKQYIRSTPKVGRNEPCPCGSGKKYKKCCGA